MIVPNLASKPVLNTRPVWLVAAVAALVTLVVGAVDVRHYLSSRSAHAAQYEKRNELAELHSDLSDQTRTQLSELDRIPWRDLGDRVTQVNVILREHSFSWLTMLSDIEGVLPYKVRLVKITPKIGDESVNLSLNGVARTREAWLAFLDNLIADPRFSEPIPKGETHPEGGSVGYTFILSVNYQPEEVSP